MKGTKSLMHVGLEEPNERRRDILNSAINVIELLKDYEKFKKLKKEKDMHKREFRLLIKEIKILMKELQESLPLVPLPKEEPKKERVIKVKPQKEKIKVKQMEIKRDEHIGKLEKDLQALRAKIAKL